MFSRINNFCKAIAFLAEVYDPFSKCIKRLLQSYLLQGFPILPILIPLWIIVGNSVRLDTNTQTQEQRKPLTTVLQTTWRWSRLHPGRGKVSNSARYLLANSTARPGATYPLSRAYESGDPQWQGPNPKILYLKSEQNNSTLRDSEIPHPSTLTLNVSDGFSYSFRLWCARTR